jgi:hypothetical protein
MGEHTRTGFQPTPAIVRDVCPKDREADVRSTPTDRVSHNPGMGSSGYRVEVVEKCCPVDLCGFDRMVRRTDVSPMEPDEVRYWCLNPNCVHFVRDSLSHATPGNYPSRDTDEPKIFEQA